MEVAKGVVEVISAKEMTEDRYGNKYRRSFKIEGNDQWFAAGGGKKPDISVKDGQGWYSLSKGDSIEFIYEQNGDYANVKSSGIKIKAKGESKPSSSGASPAPKGNSYQGGKGNFEAGIKVGHAINNAVQIAVHLGKVDEDTIRKEALKILQLSRSLEEGFENLFVQTPKEQVPSKAVSDKAKEKPKKPEAVLSVSDFDDEIPF